MLARLKYIEFVPFSLKMKICSNFEKQGRKLNTGEKEGRGTEKIEEKYIKEKGKSRRVWVSRRTISSRKPKGRSLANCRRLHARCTPVTFVYSRIASIALKGVSEKTIFMETLAQSYGSEWYTHSLRLY